MKREESPGSEHGSLNDRHEASEGGMSSPKSLRLDRGASSAEGNEKPGLSCVNQIISEVLEDEAHVLRQQDDGEEEDANQLAEPGDGEGVQTVRYARLQRKLQAMAGAPTVKSQGQSLGSASPSPFGSSLHDQSPYSPAQGTAGGNSDQHAPETNSESSNPVQAFPLMACVRPAPLAYDLCDITEEDHSAQLSQSSRLLGQQNPFSNRILVYSNNYTDRDSATISGNTGNIRTQSSIDHPDNQRVILFDKSQSSQMNALNTVGDLPTRNATMAQRHSSNSQQKVETDSSMLMDKSFPSSDQQLQITKLVPNSLQNYHQTLPYSAQRSSLHSTPVVAAAGGSAQFAMQSQIKGASPSVEDFEKASPILGATNYQNEMFRSSFRSPNPFNAHTDYNRVFPTEQRHTYGSGGNSLEYSRQMTGGSVGPDEDLIQPSKSVNSAQFYDLLKEHRNFMSSQQEMAEGINRHMSQKVIQKNMSLKRATGSATTPFGGTREASASMRRSVQGPNNNQPDGKPLSDEDLLSHMSRLSQLVPNHDQLENGDSQRGSQASRNTALKAPTQQQMLKHFQLMEQKLNSLQNQMQVRDKEVEELKNQNEKLNSKLAAESTNVKVLRSQRDLKAGSGRFTGRKGLQSVKSSVQLNSEKNQMIDDFDSAFSGSNTHGVKGGTGPIQSNDQIQATSKNALDAAQKQNKWETVVDQKDALAKLITEGSESSTNKMEFQADDYDQENEILAIKKELSSHTPSQTNPSIASPADRSPNRDDIRSAGLSEGRPSITNKTGSSMDNSKLIFCDDQYSNNQSTKLFSFVGEVEMPNQPRNFQMDAHQKDDYPGGSQRKALKQNGMTEEAPEWTFDVEMIHKQRNNKDSKEEGAADPREIQDGSLGSSHKLNETAESGSRGGNQLNITNHAVALYTSATHNQSDSSFEKDFGELRAGNPGQGTHEGKGGFRTELSNQRVARNKTPPLVPELFSLNSSIEKKDKEDVRLDQDGELEQDGEHPRDKKDEMLQQQLFGQPPSINTKQHSNTIAKMSPVGSEGKTLRKQWKIKNQEEQRARASKDSAREDEQNHAVFSYDPEVQQLKVAQGSQLSQSMQISRMQKKQPAKKSSKSIDKPFEMHAFDGGNHQDKVAAERQVEAKSNSDSNAKHFWQNGQPPRHKSPENKEFTLSDIRAVAACSPAQGQQKFSLSVPTSYQATAEKQYPSRNVCNISNTSSLGSRPKREGKRAALGPFGVKGRSKLTKKSSLGTYSEGKNAENGQSAHDISRSQADNSDADQSFIDQSNHNGKTNIAPERVRQLQQKAATMKSQIQNHEKENFALREKIANLKKLYHKKQDQVQELELRHAQSVSKQDDLKEALEERQNLIDSHQVEIEELKKQNLQGTRSQFSQIDIKNKETQIYIREFTKDQGCQIDIDIQPPQNQLPYAPQFMNGYMPPIIHPHVFASMAAPAWSNPTPEPLPFNFTVVTDVIDKMIMRDDFDLNRELNPNKAMNSQIQNTNDQKSIEALVEQCKKYEAAQQKLQTEIQQEQQQMAQMAMHQSMMAVSLPSNYQSLYPNRAAEQLDIKTDQNILLEKANTQLQGKLMLQKEKYDYMKQQFQIQIYERDGLIAELQDPQGNKRPPQMTSQRKPNGNKSKGAQSLSPSGAYTIQNFDHFNSLISNQLAKYQSSQSQTDPQMNTTEPHTNNLFKIQGNAGSQDEASSQYLQGNMNMQYCQMLDHQSLQLKPDEANGLIENGNTAHAAQQSSEYGEQVKQEAQNQAAASDGTKGGPDEQLIDSRKQSFNQQLQMFDQRQQWQRHHQIKRSLQHSSHYDVYSGQFYQQHSVVQDLDALNAGYADLDNGAYDSKGQAAQPDQQLPPQTEDTPVVKFSQDGSKMSGPMKHPVTISKWLIPANGYTLNSHYVNSAGQANELWLQQTQSAVAAAYMQELPQNSQSQVKATASGFDIRELSQQESKLEQANAQIKPERVVYYRREAHQAATEKANGKRGANERKRSRNARTTRHVSKNKSWSNQNGGPINFDVRKQHNSGSKPRVTRIIPTTSSPVKTAASRLGQPSGLTESSAQQQTCNADRSLGNQMPDCADEDVDQDELDAVEDKRIQQNQVSCTFYSQRQHTDESDVLSKPKDQDIALRVHAKRRQRLNGSKKQQLTKSFSPEKQAVDHQQAPGQAYQPQLKESACSWYIPSLQKVVPNGSSKTKTGKTQTKNNNKSRGAHVLSFGQEQEFKTRTTALRTHNNVGFGHKTQDEDEQYKSHHQSLNLDIRTSDKRDRDDNNNDRSVRGMQMNIMDTVIIHDNTSSSEDAVKMLVQDQAAPQLDAPPPIENQDNKQISNEIREHQIQAEENTFQLSSTISPEATQAQQTNKSSTTRSWLPQAEVTRPPVGSNHSTTVPNALKQLAHDQRIGTEESHRSEYPSARHLDPVVAHPNAQVSDAQLDSEFEQVKKKERQQQLQQREEKKAMKAAHLKNIMAQLQRLKDQQASVDQLSQEELNMSSFRTTQVQRQKLDEIRRKYSAPL